MEDKNHGKKCTLCALLSQAIVNDFSSKVISQDEDFALLGLMEKERMGMIIISTLHNNLDVRDRMKRSKLAKLIGTAAVGLNRKVEIITCGGKAKHYYVKIFPK